MRIDLVEVTERIVEKVKINLGCFPEPNTEGSSARFKSDNLCLMIRGRVHERVRRVDTGIVPLAAPALAISFDVMRN